MGLDFTVIASGFGALEGPVVGEDGELYAADLKRGTIWAIGRDGATTIVAERAAVGGMCLHVDGGLVASGQSVAHVDAAHARVLAELGDIAARPGRVAAAFNDLTADREGRVIVGVLRRDERGEPAPGELVMLSGPRDGAVIHDGIYPNGLAFSADGTRLFAADTFGRRVVVFDVPSSGPPVVSGELSTASIDGLPDGVATDVDGGVWVAMYRGSAILRIDAVSGVIDRFPVPAAKPLSVCFDGNDLFVVTGSDDDRGASGAVLRARSPFAGSRVNAAAV
jgi:sugar lactone lactonase YvrE